MSDNNQQEEANVSEAKAVPAGLITDTEELKATIVRAIKTVFDPEIPVDVYELGLIYDITIYPVNNVHILMTLTSPACPSAEALPNEVEAAVRSIEHIAEVQVELTFDPPYTQEMMSEVAKFELGFM